MISKNVAAIELDGVLCDLESHIVTRLENEFGKAARGGREIPLHRRYKPGSGMWNAAQEMLKDKHAYRRSNPDMGAVRLIVQCLARDYFPLIVSEREADLEIVTENWLIRAIGQENYREVGLKLVRDKTSFLAENKDMIAFAIVSEGATELNRNGIYSFSYRQPWNEGVFPCVDIHRDGVAWAQPSDGEEGGFFWDLIQEMKDE